MSGRIIILLDQLRILIFLGMGCEDSIYLEMLLNVHVLLIYYGEELVQILVFGLYLFHHVVDFGR